MKESIIGTIMLAVFVISLLDPKTGFIHALFGSIGLGMFLVWLI